MMSDVYDFHMLAVEKDSTGYYHVRWDRATKLTVRATNRNEAYQKCWAVMGEAKRHDTWTAKIDRIEPVTCGCTKPGDPEPIPPRTCPECGGNCTRPGTGPHGQIGGLCMVCGWDFLTAQPGDPS